MNENGYELEEISLTKKQKQTKFKKADFFRERRENDFDSPLMGNQRDEVIRIK